MGYLFKLILIFSLSGCLVVEKTDDADSPSHISTSPEEHELPDYEALPGPMTPEMLYGTWEATQVECTDGVYSYRNYTDRLYIDDSSATGQVSDEDCDVSVSLDIEYRSTDIRIKGESVSCSPSNCIINIELDGGSAGSYRHGTTCNNLFPQTKIQWFVGQDVIFRHLSDHDVTCVGSYHRISN